jgi:hypothetical protein
MWNKKKQMFILIAVAITTLLVTSTLGMSLTTSNDTQSYKIQITQSTETPERLSINTQRVDLAPTPISSSKGANYAFPGIHPAFGRTLGGKMQAAYLDTDLDNIIWTFSLDNGETFDPGVYYDIGGDYPSIKLWDGQRFFGTHVTDYDDLYGGPTYLFEATDPADYNTYSLVYWDWSTYGWSGMIDADIACDNSENDWEWGISSYITSTTYGNTYQDGPTIVYSSETTSGSGWISWYYYNGCAHTDVDIDPITHYGYPVYDWLDNTTWKLLLRVIDFATIETGFDTMYEITGTGNLQYPAVAAYGDKVVILAQTDENGNDDIICLYSDNKFVNFQTSIVANSAENERYPDVRFDMDGNFVCTYVMNNNLYSLISEDGGATWIDEAQINTNDAVVVEEYKTSDLGEFAIKGMWEETGSAGIEIWIGDVSAPSNLPPFIPTITGEQKLKRNKEYEFKFKATDPDVDNIYYFVEWGDNTTTTWEGPYASGYELALKHTWTTKDTFTIRCKAKDVNDAESDWATFEVSTPCPYIPSLQLFLERLFEQFPNAFPILRYLLGF